MKKLLYKIWSCLLTHLGNIRISKLPPFLYYDTVDYKVKGEQIQDILGILRPGDVIIRGYDSYLDSKGIPDPLGFSHGAIYAGDDKIIHAVAEGVSEIHVVDFCQCDRVAIFRPPQKYAKGIVRNARKYLENNTPYDFLFKNGSNAVYCFELVPLSAPRLDIKTIEIRSLLFIKKNVYLAESFFKSKDLECIYQFNPKYNIDFKKKRKSKKNGGKN